MTTPKTSFRFSRAGNTCCLLNAHNPLPPRAIHPTLLPDVLSRRPSIIVHGILPSRRVSPGTLKSREWHLQQATSGRQNNSELGILTRRTIIQPQASILSHMGQFTHRMWHGCRSILSILGRVATYLLPSRRILCTPKWPTMLMRHLRFRDCAVPRNSSSVMVVLRLRRMCGIMTDGLLSCRTLALLKGSISEDEDDVYSTGSVGYSTQRQVSNLLCLVFKLLPNNRRNFWQ